MSSGEVLLVGAPCCLHFPALLGQKALIPSQDMTVGQLTLKLRQTCKELEAVAAGDTSATGYQVLP